MPRKSHRQIRALPHSILLALIILASSVPIAANAADTSSDEHECVEKGKCTLSEVSKILMEAQKARDFVDKIGKRVKDDLETAQQNEMQVIASDEQSGEAKKRDEAINTYFNSSDQQVEMANIKPNQRTDLKNAIEYLKAIKRSFQASKGVKCKGSESKPEEIEKHRLEYVETQNARDLLKRAGNAPIIIDSDLVIAQYQNAQACASNVESIIAGPDGKGGIDKEYDNAIELFDEAAKQQSGNPARLNEIYKIAKENICDIAKKDFDWKVQPSNWNLNSDYSSFKNSVGVIQAVLDNPLDSKNQREASEVLAARKREMALLNVVDKFPAASSLVGSSGASFHGSTDGGNVTIKAPLWKSSLGSEIDASLSTPAATTGNTRLVSLDGVSDATTLQLNGRRTWALGAKNVQVFTAGVAAQGGIKSHDYYASNTATQTDTIVDHPTKMSAYLGASFGMWGGENNSFVLIKYQQAKSRIDQDATTICQSLSAPCITGSFGLPTPQHTQLASIEYRYAGDDNGWAIAPVVTRALKDMSSINAIDIPFYFIPSDSDKSSLTGGFDLGWRSDSQWNFGLFIGTNFNLFGN